jgi:hypothetical protein
MPYITLEHKSNRVVEKAFRSIHMKGVFHMDGIRTVGGAGAAKKKLISKGNKEAYFLWSPCSGELSCQQI